MSFNNPFQNIFSRKARYLASLIVLFAFIISSCATQHKYKKHKPIPCPCEKENKR
jgi:hypothetical protein